MLLTNENQIVLAGRRIEALGHRRAESRNDVCVELIHFSDDLGGQTHSVSGVFGGLDNYRFYRIDEVDEEHDGQHNYTVVLAVRDDLLYEVAERVKLSAQKNLFAHGINFQVVPFTFWQNFFQPLFANSLF